MLALRHFRVVCDLAPEGMMPDVRFDPSSAVTFNVAEGRVHRPGSGAHVLIGADTLLALAAAGGDQATAGLAHAMGLEIGRRVAHRLHGSASTVTVETALDHLGGELAVSGLGCLSLERWGKAAVLVVEGSPFGAAGDELMQGTLGTAVAEATGRPVVAVFLERDHEHARFFLGGRAGAEKLEAWLAQGMPWGHAIVRLHHGVGSPSPSKTSSARGDA